VRRLEFPAFENTKTAAVYHKRPAVWDGGKSSSAKRGRRDRNAGTAAGVER